MTNQEAWVRFFCETVHSYGDLKLAAKEADRMLKQFRKRQERLRKLQEKEDYRVAVIRRGS